MSLVVAQQSGRFEQTLLAGQVGIAVFGMVTFLFAPREDEPVALYPINDAAEDAIPALLSAPDTLVLARGQLDGSYIVRGERPGFIEGLLREGVLVLNASAPGCGPLREGAMP